MRTRPARKTPDLPQVVYRTLHPKEKEVVLSAVDIQSSAYAPYSNYKVGVAILGTNGKIYTGVNVENVFYKAMHAEEVALSEMAKDKCRRFMTLCCAALNGGIPCLSCRQFMREFSGEDLEDVIIIGVKNGIQDRVIRCTFADIIGVDSFGPQDLGINPMKY
ncbi:MAG: cytidine deaminase [Candidatus Liptonbacteria bacterium]|nr:cytidine deaminase [Candidatus Liptonbacteria bacterium]